MNNEQPTVVALIASGVVGGISAYIAATLVQMLFHGTAIDWTRGIPVSVICAICIPIVVAMQSKKKSKL